MKRIFVFLVLPLALLILGGWTIFARWVREPSALPEAAMVVGACARHEIGFDDTSVLAQFNKTDEILANPEHFWRQDRGHSLIALSPHLKTESLPPDEWYELMGEIAQLSPEERRGERHYLAARMIMDHKEIYCTVGARIIQSLLPPDAGLETTVHLTAFTQPAAFTTNNAIVMNVDVSHYFGKSAYFFNTLNHELFHIGYWRYQPYQQEIWPQSYSLKSALVILQNEGIATYSQELSNAYYPAMLEIDHQLSQSMLALRFFVGRVNDLLQDAATLPEDDVLLDLYSGFNQRALYAVGAHMARTIDQELGREALAGTIALGPQAFVQTYNQLVQESWKISEVPRTLSLNAFQQLRKSAVEATYDRIPELLEGIRSTTADNLDGAKFEEIRSAGLVLQGSDEQQLAVQVFESMAALFPDHPFSHIYLAEAYQLVGDFGLAADSFQKAITIDPSLIALIR